MAAALALSIAAWAQTPAVRTPETVPADRMLDLDECIGLALRNEPSIRQAEAQVDGRTGQVQQARSKLMPNASVSSSTGLDGASGGSTGVTYGGSQLIYDFGKSQAGLSQAKRQRAASVEDMSGTRADVILNVKQSYYTKLRANKLVAVYTENLKAQEARLAQARARKEAGVAAQADVLQAEAALASARVDLVTARNDAEQARVDLNSAMGIEITSPTRIADGSEPESPVPGEEEAVKLALERRPEVKSLALGVSAAESGVKSARTGNMPSIATSYSNRSTMGGGVFGTPDSWAWNVGVTWGFYDSGSTAGAVRQAREQVTTARESLFGARQQVAREVVQARLNLISASEQLAASQVEVVSARENLAAATGKYEAQVGILLEVLDAQAALVKAQTNELSARYGLSIARAALERATGATTMKARS